MYQKKITYIRTILFFPISVLIVHSILFAQTLGKMAESSFIEDNNELTKPEITSINDPVRAIANIDLYPGLEATLFS